jgi:hypothetical protein
LLLDELDDLLDLLYEANGTHSRVHHEQPYQIHRYYRDKETKKKKKKKKKKEDQR